MWPQGPDPGFKMYLEFVFKQSHFPLIFPFDVTGSDFLIADPDRHCKIKVNLKKKDFLIFGIPRSTYLGFEVSLS